MDDASLSSIGADPTGDSAHSTPTTSTGGVPIDTPNMRPQLHDQPAMWYRNFKNMNAKERDWEKFNNVHVSTLLPGDALMRAVDACQKGELDVLKQCLSHGVSPNALDADGCSLLHWAAINNRPEEIKFLLSEGADVNILGGILVSSPLHWSARVGHLYASQLLVRAGAACNVRDSQGYTPFHLAVQGNFTPLIAYMCAKYPHELDVPDNSENEKEEEESGSKHQSPCKIVNIADHKGMTALMWAALRTYGMFPIRVLVREGADVGRTEHLQGNTALHFAAQERNVTAIKELVAAGADPYAMNKDRETPIDIARNTRNQATVRALEAAGRRMDIAAGRSKRRCCEDNDSLRKAREFTLPVLLFGVSAVLFHTIHYAFAAAILLLFALAVRLRMDARFDMVKTLYPLGVTVAEGSTMTCTWFYYVHGWVPWWAQIGYVLASALLWMSLVRILYANPGRITPPTNRQQLLIELVEGNRLESFCFTCYVPKPPFSKHCATCDHCVRAFDHHCPWVNACVTRKNQREFMVFVSMVALSSFIFSAATISFIGYELRGASLGLVVERYAWLFITVVLAMFHVLMLSGLFLQQCVQISALETTNSRLKRGRGGRGHGHSHGGGGGGDDSEHAHSHGGHGGMLGDYDELTCGQRLKNILDFCVGH